MADYFITMFPSFLLISIQSILASWMCLKIICLSTPDHLNFLYISSGKSTTNARLLGGLSISCSLFMAIATLLFMYPKNIDSFEQSGLIVAAVSIALVTLYGYIDDKYEVRVRFKLSLQLVSILSFAFYMAPQLSVNHPILAFLVTSFFGLALVNGTNLLDGLDTLSIKIGSAGLVAFIYLGYLSNSQATIYLSATLLSSFSMFYFFNREPAKVYMGEIGGSIIGLVFYIQSNFCFVNLKSNLGMTNLEALPLVLIAGSFPISELGISFFRRMWCKKTPFRGDKLHLHYILKNTYKLSASETSSRMAVSSVLLLTIGFAIARKSHPLLALVLVVVTTLQIYLTLCLKKWKAAQGKESLADLHMIFQGKEITLLNSNQFNSIDFSIEDAKKIKPKKSA